MHIHQLIIFEMKPKIKIPGMNFLKNHPKTESLLNVPDGHVIVDRKEWREIIEFFEEHPEMMSEIGKKKPE